MRRREALAGLAQLAIAYSVKPAETVPFFLFG